MYLYVYSTYMCICTYMCILGASVTKYLEHLDEIKKSMSHDNHMIPVYLIISCDK